jgi:hypothetical protein
VLGVSIWVSIWVDALKLHFLRLATVPCHKSARSLSITVWSCRRPGLFITDPINILPSHQQDGIPDLDRHPPFTPRHPARKNVGPERQLAVQLNSFRFISSALITHVSHLVLTRRQSLPESAILGVQRHCRIHSLLEQNIVHRQVGVGTTSGRELDCERQQLAIAWCTYSNTQGGHGKRVACHCA